MQQSLAFLLRWVVVGLALAFIVLVLRGQGVAPTSSTGTASARVDSYADAVALAAPAVVNIYATKLVAEPQVPPGLAAQIMGMSPAGRPRHRLEQSLGSAVIVTEDGYMLTNHHVIRAAVEIQAVLWDGRIASAEIVGSDPDTDLAVLKIDGSNLTTVGFAPADSVRIGDVVLAIGNPFGIGQTVTMGIVSATGRSRLNLSTYESFIQTDAAINTGNSGGALIDVEGRLIGINTANLARNIGAEGIGFAIPYSIASRVLDDIVRQGFVTRGWLGAEFDERELRSTLSGEVRPALIVVTVNASGPASQAGLQRGDLVLRLAGEDVVSVAQARELESAQEPGERVRVEGLRGGIPFSVEVVLQQRPRL
ncbi:MAG: trypsin-like peptidase domain-containing protein [Xanthomonadales bacterium]|nr:trypsin-like peptidase domain-containing protein [Xanthomonadales bacterium]MCB1634380.1 trypsin-like peptidase domain-containing protein [Xanthomonadales bacterium]MCB1641414.1 trypsin-like peptidase domain-containing protein [Xanthomonadales bacterium]